MPAGAAPTAPMGWRADPWGRHQVRFFDGEHWTEHVADGGLCSIDSTPVADLPRSRPVPARRSPRVDLDGPRVLDGPAGVDGEAPAVALDDRLVLVDEEPDERGVRRLALPDDTPAGQVVAPHRPLPRRALRALAADPTPPTTALDVLDRAGARVLRLARPALRTVPVVDVVDRDGRGGTIEADSVVQGLRARVRLADGTTLGVLEAHADAPSWLRVVDDDGAVLARLTPVWDVPGARSWLPPGVLLVDRRPPEGREHDTGRARLLLAALLSPALLLPRGGR